MAISDILGLGYAHAIAAGAAHYHPLSGNRPVFQDRAIAQRWNRLWLVACAMASKRFADPAAELHNFKVSHRQRVVSLLDAGIPWNTIIGGRTGTPLDNPLMPLREFELSRQLAIERRRRSIGKRNPRGKGKRRANG